MSTRTLLPLLALGLTACAVLPAGASAATAGGGVHAVAPLEGPPLDLASVALGQRDRDLTLVVRARKKIEPADLVAGKGRLCTTFVQRGDESSMCIERSGGHWRLRHGAAVVSGASVGQPRGGTLTVRVAPDAVGLSTGVLRWHVAVTPAGCEGDGCVSRAPRGDGSYPGRVWRAVLTGCRATGPAQVSRGPRGKRIALTYDDGPSGFTPALLTTLKNLGVHATFFEIGQQVSGNAAVVRRILAEGHELANHSWNHANLGGGGPGATSQLARTNAAIRRVSGYTPCVFRPPYGSTGANLVSRVRALGMTSILWSVDPLDWRLPGTGAIVSRVLSQTGPGAIILSHDGGGPRAQTLAAAPQIIRALRSRGYRFVTVSELLGYEQRLSLQK